MTTPLNHVGNAKQYKNWLVKVPEVTAFFWIIKVLATTVGETFADYLNVTLGFGLNGTTVVTIVALAVALIFQFKSTKYRPSLYWLVVVLISITGTLFTDNLTDGNTPSSTATGTAIGSGARNTKLMLGTCTFGAANMASSYNGGGKSDWFLPSKDELAELANQKSINRFLGFADWGGFVEDNVWSSSENGAVNAWGQGFTGGDQDASDKDGTFYVRPVRAF
jgi:hypothetical protein